MNWFVYVLGGAEKVSAQPPLEPPTQTIDRDTECMYFNNTFITKRNIFPRK